MLRINDKSVKYFSPKYNTPHLKHKPLPLPKSFFGWIWPLITYPEPKVRNESHVIFSVHKSNSPALYILCTCLAQIIETSGLDAAIYLRVLSFGEEELILKRLPSYYLINFTMLKFEQVVSSSSGSAFGA